MSTLYEHYNTNDDNAGDIRGSIAQGQSFTPATAHTIISAKFYLKRVGSPTGNLVVDLYASDANGKPTGSSLGSGSIVASSVSNSAYTWTEITLASGVALDASVKRILILTLSSGDASNYISFRMDNTSPTYSGGTLVYTTNGGTSWTAESTQDMMFEEYGPSAGTISQVNIADVWKNINWSNSRINIGDVWKSIPYAAINIGDTWKTLWGTPPVSNGSFLLQEDGTSYILQESGDKIKLESSE